MLDITVHASVADHVRLGVVEARQILIRPAPGALRGEIAEVCRALREQYAGREPGQIGELQPARELYRRMGVDPTRLRPSSEALLRRVLHGEDPPATNNVVDAGSLCALEFLLPVGLHDLDAVRGALVLRRGKPIEMFEAIGGSYHSVEGRLVLADETGPCGSPTSGSLRTMITPATERCLLVLYAPSTVPAARLEEHVRVAAERLRRFTDGKIVGTAVLPRA